MHPLNGLITHRLLISQTLYKGLLAGHDVVTNLAHALGGALVTDALQRATLVTVTLLAVRERVEAGVTGVTAAAGHVGLASTQTQTRTLQTRSSQLHFWQYGNEWKPGSQVSQRRPATLGLHLHKHKHEHCKHEHCKHEHCKHEQE